MVHTVSFIYLHSNEYEFFTIHLLYSNSFLLVAAVKLCSFSQCLRPTLVCCSFFRSALSRFNANFQHYSQITLSARGIAHKYQHTSHLQRKSQWRKRLFLGRFLQILAHVCITLCTVNTHTYMLVLLPYTMAQISCCMAACTSRGL